MYSFNYLEKIWDQVEKNIVNERERYRNYYNIIEDYIQDKNIIIGGSHGLNILLKTSSLDDYFYDFYAEHALTDANDLTNELELKNTNKDVIMLKTIIPYIKYGIYINNRLLVLFTKITGETYKIIEPVDVFDPKLNKRFLVIPPEIQLLDIYRILYSPNRVEDWENALYNENEIYVNLKKRFTDLEKTGADEPDITMDVKKKIEMLLFQEFVVNNNNIVLIGEHAIRLIIQSEMSSTVIQVISQNDIESDFETIKKIIQTVYKGPIQKLTRDIKILQDFRIKRTTIKIGEKGKEVIYIYNAAQYDLIPFNIAGYQKNKIQVGNPFILLRFLLIDYWMLRLVKSMNLIDDNFYKLRTDSILRKFIILRNMLATEEETFVTSFRRKRAKKINEKYVDSGTNSFLNIFTIDTANYIGEYDNELISQKIHIQQMDIKFHDYFPAQYKEHHGELRKLNLDK